MLPLFPLPSAIRFNGVRGVNAGDPGSTVLVRTGLAAVPIPPDACSVTPPVVLVVVIEPP